MVVNFNAPIQVLLKTIKLAIFCILMRIKFVIDPTARKRDLEEITESYNLPSEGLKYLEWRNEYTVSNFFYTWNMIVDFFKTNMQVPARCIASIKTMLSSNLWKK